MTNKTFELVNENIKDWIDTQFVEADPYQNNEARSEIVLCVDWEAQSCTVETHDKTNSTPMREYYNLDQIFTLPENVDAAAFKKYYDAKIRPLLQMRGEFFESVWNGNNYIGTFTDEEEEDEYNSSCGFYTEADVNIMDICKECPEHDKYVYFSIGESFNSYEDIIDIVNGADIDFMTCNLADSKTVSKIMEWLTDECVFIGVKDDGDELEDIREYIREMI